MGSLSVRLQALRHRRCSISQLSPFKKGKVFPKTILLSIPDRDKTRKVMRPDKLHVLCEDSAAVGMAGHGVLWQSSNSEAANDVQGSMG